jgi:hypothetical protein
VAFGNGLFVAVSSDGTNRVMTSPDGITWTSRTSAADNGWYGVTYGNGLFVAVAFSGTGNRVMTSPDGITWTSRTSAADNPWYGITYGNGQFVAVSGNGNGNRVMTSADGFTWTARSTSVELGWRNITFGNGSVIVISNQGGGDQALRITISAPENSEPAPQPTVDAAAAAREAAAKRETEIRVARTELIERVVNKKDLKPSLFDQADIRGLLSFVSRKDDPCGRLGLEDEQALARDQHVARTIAVDLRLASHAA